MAGVFQPNVFQNNVFQVDVVRDQPSGGWERHPYVRGPKRVRFKFKEEEERHPEVAKIIHDLSQVDALDRDLEIALRLRLRQENVAYRMLYLMWLKYEHDRIRRERDEEEISVAMLLN